MLRPRLVIRQRTIAAVVAPLALALSMGISHQAMALCSYTPGPGGTLGNDIVDCDSADPGPINTIGGDDQITVDSPAVIGVDDRLNKPTMINSGDDDDTITVNGGTVWGRTQAGSGEDTVFINGGDLYGQINAGDGNDVVIMTDGTTHGDANTAGTAISNTNGHLIGGGGDDLMMVFGGTVHGEVQGGAGDDLIVLFGGTTGNAEPSAPGVNGDLVYVDGAVVNGIEYAAGSKSQVFLRSGSIGEIEDEDGSDNTIIVDPINSKDSADFVGVTDRTAVETLLGTGVGHAELKDDPVLTFTADELELGDGTDKLTFKGAVNMGDDDERNIVFGHSSGELELNGGGGIDTLKFEDESEMEFDEITGFEFLKIEEESTLVLEGTEYIFGSTVGPVFDPLGPGGIEIDGSSTIWLTGLESLSTPHIEIGAADGDAEPLKVSNQYAAFDPGGKLMFGAMPAGGGDDDDDDEGEAGEPIDAIVHTGPNTIVNGGTMGMLNGIAGDHVEFVGGGYVSDNNTGKFVIDTQLGGSNSITDRFDFDPTQAVDGLTTIYVNNAGGKGAFTGHGATDGIVIVTGPDGFGPTGAFQLGVNLTGRREVLAGAFSYQAITSGTTVRLQSDVLDQVPAYTVASSATQRFASTGLGTLYKRLGEVRLGHSNDRTFAGGAGSVWARGLYGDYDVSPETGYGFSQKTDGVLMGVDGTVATESGGRMIFGVFGGYGSSDADVSATIWGQNSTSKIDLSGWSVGGYGTYWENGRPGMGYYFDGVIKADILDYDMTSAARSTSATTDGYAATISGETGYGFGLGGNLSLQPQAQLSYTTVSISNYTDSYNISVGNGAAESLIGRASLQLQGNYGSGNSGWFAPYVIASVLSEFLGDNETVVAGTPFQNDMGLTWFEAGGGVTAELSNAISLYGSAEYSFGDVEGWGGTGGVKARW